MIVESIEWDEANTDHATQRLSMAEIEQIIGNAESYAPHRRHPERVLIESTTNGGKRGLVIAHYDQGRDSLRPITAWEVR